MLSYKISVSTWRRDIVRFFLKVVYNNPSWYIFLKKHSSKEDYVESDQWNVYEYFWTMLLLHYEAEVCSRARLHLYCMPCPHKKTIIKLFTEKCTVL